MNQNPVVLPLVVAFTVWAISVNVFQNEKDTKGTKTVQEFIAPYAGWVIIAIVLSFASDMGATHELGIGFAYLILLAVLMIHGARVFTKVNGMLSGTNQTAS